MHVDQHELQFNNPFLADRQIASPVNARQRAAEKCKVEADRLGQALRLANATGRPDGTPPMRWLLDCGLAVKDGESYPAEAALIAAYGARNSVLVATPTARDCGLVTAPAASGRTRC
jgi:hypothetical protein